MKASGLFKFILMVIFVFSFAVNHYTPRAINAYTGHDRSYIIAIGYLMLEMKQADNRHTPIIKVRIRL